MESSSAPRLTQSNSFFESDDDALEAESDNHPTITAAGIDQQQKEPAGPDKPLKRVRRLLEDSSGEEDCGPTSITDEGHKASENSIKLPASKKMKKWLDSNSESEASSESETDSNSQCGQRGARHVEGNTGNVAGAESRSDAGGSESDSEEDQLMIEVDYQSPGEASDGEMKSVRGKDIGSPVQDTLLLVQDGDFNHELETERGSLTTLELEESAHCS